MNKIIFLIISFCFIFNITSIKSFAEETNSEVIQLETEINEKVEEDIEVEGNSKSELSIFDNLDLDKDNDGKIDEDTLFSKIWKQDIVRTDIPSYLLKEQLTFNYKKGPISKVQFYGAYIGNFKSSWEDDGYHTTYDPNTIQIGAIGKIKKINTDFNILVNPKPVNDRNYMQNFFADAFLVQNSIPHHKVIVGYSRNQVGKEGGSGGYVLPFVNRSQIARNFGSTRALGVRLVGDYSLVDYDLAFNSSDRYFHTPFAGPEFTGWVNIKPFGKTDGRFGRLTLGGGLNAGHNNTNYTVGGLYVGYKYKRLWTNFEYAIADGYNGSYVSTNKAQGFNYTLGYKVHPRLQLIARYDQFDPNRDVANNTKREYTAGINYFIRGQALRLILNYVFCSNENMPDSHRIIVGTQILL